MGSLPISLNVYAEPASLLRVLGVPTAGTALPMTVSCPVCTKPRLTLFEDTITGGAWHYCSVCRRGGDLIELAAATWGMSPAATVAKLAAAGLPFPPGTSDQDAVDRYVVRRPQVRRRLLDFWESSRTYLAEARSKELGALRGRFRLHFDLGPAKWRAGPGKWLGANHRRAVVGAIIPSMGRHAPGGMETITQYRLFPGSWKEALVIPFRDLPGRVCGFWMAARHGETYRNPLAGTAKPAEAGLAGLDTVDESKAPFGDRVIAVDCPALAVRLQMRNCAFSDRPLPIVAWHDDRKFCTRDAWRALGGKRPVFWCLAPSAAVVHQAVLTDGDLSVFKTHPGTQVTREVLDHCVRDNEPRDLARKVIRWAKPWRVALAEWAATAPDGAVEELLLGLEGYGHHRPDVCQHDTRLMTFCWERRLARTASIGSRKVTEYQGQWWTGPAERPTVVMNATLRIDGLVDEDGTPHYHGRLILQDEPIHFSAPVTRMSQAAAEVLAGVVARHGRGVLYVAPNWGKTLIAAALAFQNPNGL